MVEDRGQKSGFRRRRPQIILPTPDRAKKRSSRMGSVARRLKTSMATVSGTRLREFGLFAQGGPKIGILHIRIFLSSISIR
jgi:hypothetical protein